MVKRLSTGALEAALHTLPQWRYEEGALVWKRRFKTFSEAFGVAARVALLAEKHDHHPDIILSYTQLTLKLTTHDAGGLTERDLNFAQAFDALV